MPSTTCRSSGRPPRKASAASASAPWGLATILRDLRPDLLLVEQVAARPRQGVTSMFDFGRSYALLLGVAADIRIPVEFATPQAWVRHHGLAGPLVVAPAIDVTDEESHPEIIPDIIPPTAVPLAIEIAPVPSGAPLASIDLDRVMTPLVFMARLTEAENDAIAQAAMSNAGMFRSMLSLTAAQEVQLDDARTIGGVMAMVAAGILTEERAAEVLGRE